MDENIVKMFASTTAIIILILYLGLVYYIQKKYASNLKSKNIFLFMFNSTDVGFVVKQLFKNSHKEDVKYSILLIFLRLLLIVFVISGVIWANS